MEENKIEAAGLNGYELRARFDAASGRELRQLRAVIEQRYEGDGEFQASETTDEILEGESAAELSGAGGQAGEAEKERD